MTLAISLNEATDLIHDVLVAAVASAMFNGVSASYQTTAFFAPDGNPPWVGKAQIRVWLCHRFAFLSAGAVAIYGASVTMAIAAEAPRWEI